MRHELAGLRDRTLYNSPTRLSYTHPRSAKDQDDLNCRRNDPKKGNLHSFRKVATCYPLESLDYSRAEYVDISSKKAGDRCCCGHNEDNRSSKASGGGVPAAGREEAIKGAEKDAVEEYGGHVAHYYRTKLEEKQAAKLISGGILAKS